MAAWQAGRREAASMFNAEQATFLGTIGCSAQELFDFVDDSLRYGEPDFATTLAVTGLRRKYFLEVMKAKSTGRVIDMDTLPPKSAEVDGMAWLPRIIEKARAKLRGEMPPDLMYGCGGDRAFMQEVRMKLPDFLQLVWEAGEDNRHIIETVKKAAGKR